MLFFAHGTCPLITWLIIAPTWHNMFTLIQPGRNKRVRSRNYDAHSRPTSGGDDISQTICYGASHTEKDLWWNPSINCNTKGFSLCATKCELVFVFSIMCYQSLCLFLESIYVFFKKTYRWRCEALFIEKPSGCLRYKIMESLIGRYSFCGTFMAQLEWN